LNKEGKKGGSLLSAMAGSRGEECCTFTKKEGKVAYPVALVGRVPKRKEKRPHFVISFAGARLSIEKEKEGRRPIIPITKGGEEGGERLPYSLPH